MKLQQMVGLSVFNVEDGNQIGKVLDILLDDNWRIKGIQLEGKSMFSPHIKVVFWEDIVAYGDDAVMIRNQQAIRKLEAENIQFTFANGNGKLKELPVLTEDGMMIGHVTDVYFDQDMGSTITGIEISDGFISDLMEGRKVLPVTSEVTKGENAIIVPPDCDKLGESSINSVNG